VVAPDHVDAATDEVLRDITAHRGQRLRVYEALAHSHTLVELVSALGRYFIDESTLPPRSRELGILRVAARVGAEYEYAQHVPRAVAAGLTGDEITRVTGSSAAGWPARDGAVLRMADELLTEGGVTDDTWARLGSLFSHAQVVDLVVLLGYYVLIATTTNTLRVPLEPDSARWPDAAAPSVLHLTARKGSVLA
jgi:alkylhydroperoxidase family enzyme